MRTLHRLLSALLQAKSRQETGIDFRYLNLETEDIYAISG